MAVADRHGLPVSVCAESATPHEVTLATSTLLQMVVPNAPKNLIGDNAYDSDHLDTQLKFYGIEIIAHIVERERIRLRIAVGWNDTDGVGKSRGSLPGCRTFVAWSSDMNGTPTIFSECFALPQL